VVTQIGNQHGLSVRGSARATALPGDQVEAYQRDGFVSPITALSILEASLGGRPKAVELSLTNLSFGWAYDLATRSGVLGPDILVWARRCSQRELSDLVHRHAGRLVRRRVFRTRSDLPRRHVHQRITSGLS